MKKGVTTDPNDEFQEYFKTSWEEGEAEWLSPSDKCSLCSSWFSGCRWGASLALLRSGVIFAPLPLPSATASWGWDPKWGAALWVLCVVFIWDVRWGVVKNRLFTVRPTVRVDPPSPLRSAFRDFFGVCLTLDYDYMCSEMDSSQRKSLFNPTTRITTPPYCLLLLCHKMVG